jgi:ABC-type dipeptide/oligopeptide/nickel transport system ATPase subunit
MSTVTYIGELLQDGHLSVTPRVRRALKLSPGDQLRVTVTRGSDHDENMLVEPLESLDKSSLERIANYRFSRQTQRRMEKLLAKNQEGTLTPDEQEELDYMNQQSLLWRARKAQARLLLSSRM